MTHVRQELRMTFALPADGATPWAPSASPAPNYERRIGRGRVLRITATEVTCGKQRLAIDAIDEVSYFHEPVCGRRLAVLLFLLPPLGLIALAWHHGRYRCRLRAGRNTIDVILRRGSPGSARRKEVDEAWAAMVALVHRVVSPVVVDRLADRIAAGATVRIGHTRFDADGVSAPPARRLAWAELGAPTFDGRWFHLEGLDRRGRHRSVGRVAARQPNAVVVPMLTQLVRVRAGQAPGTARASATSLESDAYVGVREWRGARSVAVVLAFALVGTVVAARVHHASAPDPNAAKPAWATTWDPRVASIVAFVEHSRRLAFSHPVSVEFLSNEDFLAWVTAQRDETASREPVEPGSGNVSPAPTDIAVTSMVVGVYFPADRIVRVRGQELTPDVRVTLAHELTHALQDQTFDLDALQQHADDDGRAAGLTAVLEGDAVTVEREYYESLTAGEQDAVSSSETGEGGLSAQFSDARLAGAYLPYVFGPQLIATLAATGGDKARNQALEHPPSSDLGVLDPMTFITGDDGPAKVSTPVPPLELTADAHGTVGALTWYLALSARIDPRLVARTIDEWDGDRYVSYRRGADQCIDAVVHVRPLNSPDHLSDVFSRWAWGNGPTITVAGNDIHITTCQPLAAGSTGASLRVIYARNQLVLNGIEAGWTAPLAHCMADRALMELPVATLTATPLVLPTDWADRLELYRTVCAH